MQVLADGVPPLKKLVQDMLLTHPAATVNVAAILPLDLRHELIIYGLQKQAITGSLVSRLSADCVELDLTGVALSRMQLDHIAAAKALRSLTVSDSPAIDALSVCSILVLDQLTKLSVHRCAKLELWDIVDRVPIRLRRLTELHLDVQPLVLDALRQLFYFAPSIKRLELNTAINNELAEGKTRGGGSALRGSATLPSVQHLSISGHIEQQAFAYFLASCTDLRYLSIGGLLNVPHHKPFALPADFTFRTPNLTTLEFKNCNLVAKDMMIQLFSNLPALRKLHGFFSGGSGLPGLPLLGHAATLGTAHSFLFSDMQITFDTTSTQLWAVLQTLPVLGLPSLVQFLESTTFLPPEGVGVFETPEKRRGYIGGVFAEHRPRTMNLCGLPDLQQLSQDPLFLQLASTVTDLLLTSVTISSVATLAELFPAVEKITIGPQLQFFAFVQAKPTDPTFAHITTLAMQFGRYARSKQLRKFIKSLLRLAPNLETLDVKFTTVGLHPPELMSIDFLQFGRALRTLRFRVVGKGLRLTHKHPATNDVLRRITELKLGDLALLEARDALIRVEVFDGRLPQVPVPSHKSLRSLKLRDSSFLAGLKAMEKHLMLNLTHLEVNDYLPSPKSLLHLAQLCPSLIKINFNPSWVVPKFNPEVNGVDDATLRAVLKLLPRLSSLVGPVALVDSVEEGELAYGLGMKLYLRTLTDRTLSSSKAILELSTTRRVVGVHTIDATRSSWLYQMFGTEEVLDKIRRLGPQVFIFNGATLQFRNPFVDTFHQFESLRKLEMKNCPAIHPAFLTAALTHSGLRSLAITNATFMSLSHYEINPFINQGKKYPNLRHLHLGNTALINDYTIEDLISTYPSLESLVLVNTQVSSEGVAKFTAAHHSVRLLTEMADLTASHPQTSHVHQTSRAKFWNPMAEFGFKFDPSLPTVNVEVHLIDDTRFNLTLNPIHSVRQLFSLVKNARPLKRSFELFVSYSQTPLSTKMDETLESVGIRALPNGAVVTLHQEEGLDHDFWAEDFIQTPEPAHEYSQRAAGPATPLKESVYTPAPKRRKIDCSTPPAEPKNVADGGGAEGGESMGDLDGTEAEEGEEQSDVDMDDDEIDAADLASDDDGANVDADALMFDTEKENKMLRTSQEQRSAAKHAALMQKRMDVQAQQVKQAVDEHRANQERTLRGYTTTAQNRYGSIRHRLGGEDWEGSAFPDDNDEEFKLALELSRHVK